MKVLNVGSGNRPLPNLAFIEYLKELFRVPIDPKWEYVNIDKQNVQSVDYIVDLERGRLPFDDNTFDMFFMIHVFEHLDDTFHLMQELYRIAKPGAKLFIVCPYWTHPWSVGDPDHKKLINEYSFLWYDKIFRKSQDGTPSTPVDLTCDWKYNYQDISWEHMREPPYFIPVLTNICPVLEARK